MENVLEMKDITKRFGSVTVFRDVNISLQKGEVLALVGENGAGKSTLMNVLSGHYPDGTFEGQIILNGEEKKFKNPNDSKNAGIEMIRQEISLHLDLTIAENVYLGDWPRRKNKSVDWKTLFKETKKYLDEVGLNADPRELVRNLSTSEQQLLSIAKALARHPKLLVLDEPTSALTERDAANLLNIIRRLKDTGISCIYISHHLEEVFEIADRVVVLRDGNIISDYGREEVIEAKIIEDMVGRKIDDMYPKVETSVGEEVLRVEKLTVAHPYILNKNIVENISFNVRRGEILGIGGLVGAGRSEAVNAVFGTMKRLSGDIYIDNKKVDISSPLDAIENGIGLVTEDRKKTGLISMMDLRENMTLASLNMISSRGVIKKSKEREVSESFYKKMRVKAEGINTNIMNLSGGNQQKIVLAKWLMQDLEVLILDEPTRGVDVGAKVEIYNIINELVKSGVAIIMVSSDLPELIGMSDRIIVLSGGQIRADIMRNEVSQEKIMRAATGLEEYHSI
jgi:ABC-type sugar transport system ATPase subunit